METKTNLDLFKKVELKERSRTGGDKVTIANNKSSIYIGKTIRDQICLSVGERFDLYRMGKTFALKRAKAGVLKVSAHGGSCCIRSTNACIEILAMNGGCYKNDAWVENDVIFFKPIEKVGE